MMRRIGFIAFAVLLVASAAGSALAQEGVARNAAEAKFMPFPAMPTCTQGTVEDGDPSKGPSVILAKATAGCVFPWHWHTPTEQVMIVSGTAVAEMKDGKPVTLKPGGFAMMPSKHVHRFKCTTACSLFIHSDAPFDIHYVDKDGKEMSADDALKAVGEKTAPMPK
jgi:quercetin dioxygenase-like cupin family protein